MQKGITIEELYAMGILNKSEAVKHVTKEFTSKKVQVLKEWTFYHYYNPIEPSSTQPEFLADTPDAEYDDALKDVPKNSPGAKAWKDQDLWDTRNRGVPRDRKSVV